MVLSAVNATLVGWPRVRSPEPSRVASLLLSFSELATHLTLSYTLQLDLLQESDAQERRWLLAVELHSYFIRKRLKTLFLQLIDQTFIEKLFYGSVCYRAT